MTVELTERAVGDVHEFLKDGQVVGRLVWVGCTDDAHPAAGWWLEIPGNPDLSTVLYKVPRRLAHDLARARSEGESGSLGFAYEMVSDQVSGLLDGPNLRTGVE
jgi:hypothetical protein